MRGLGVEKRKLVYVSKINVSDIREWPCPDADSSVIQFDESRYDQLVTKAKRICNQIWTHGIATSEDELPIEKCGCSFCQEKSFAFPDAVRPKSDGSGESDPDTSEMGVRAEEAVETGVSVALYRPLLPKRKPGICLPCLIRTIHVFWMWIATIS